jgi:hypothetical protein
MDEIYLIQGIIETHVKIKIPLYIKIYFECLIK